MAATIHSLPFELRSKIYDHALKDTVVTIYLQLQHADTAVDIHRGFSGAWFYSLPHELALKK